MAMKTDQLFVHSFNRHISIPVKQQGMALLTVLLLVVAIVVVAGSMLASQKLSIRQTSLVLDNDRSSQNLQSGFVIAKAIIEQEQKTNDHDSMNDVWAKPMPPIEIDNQRIQIHITDASSRFNLNNLYQNQQVNVLAYASLQSLLASLGLKSDIAKQILDFQDMDNSVYEDGGDENLIYADGGSFANQPFISVEQLLALPDMDMASYQKLRPFISVSPKFLPINVNTADPLLISAVLNAKVVNSNNPNNTNNTNNANNPKQLSNILPEQLPDFYKNPQKSAESLWQQPVFQAYLDRHKNNNNENNQSQQKRMFAVNSQAFNVQITVTDHANMGDGETHTQRQRYATALLIKSDQPTAQNSTNNNMPVNQDNSNDSGKNWQILYPRYWAYQPQ